MKGRKFSRRRSPWWYRPPDKTFMKRFLKAYRNSLRRNPSRWAANLNAGIQLEVDLASQRHEIEYLPTKVTKPKPLGRVL